MDVEEPAQPTERETMIAELARLGWANDPEDGRIEVAAGHLLDYLSRELGTYDARTFLVDAALKALLLSYEYRESEIDFVDLADDRLMASYEGFVLDARRVAEECLARAPDAHVRVELEGFKRGLREEDSP